MPLHHPQSVLQRSQPICSATRAYHLGKLFQHGPYDHRDSLRPEMNVHISNSCLQHLSVSFPPTHTINKGNTVSKSCTPSASRTGVKETGRYRDTGSGIRDVTGGKQTSTGVKRQGRRRVKACNQPFQRRRKPLSTSSVFFLFLSFRKRGARSELHEPVASVAIWFRRSSDVVQVGVDSCCVMFAIFDRTFGALYNLDGPGRAHRVAQVIDVVAHCHEEIEKQLTPSLHLHLHGATALEGFPTADDER